MKYVTVQVHVDWRGIVCAVRGHQWKRSRLFLGGRACTFCGWMDTTNACTSVAWTRFNTETGETSSTHDPDWCGRHERSKKVCAELLR